MRRKVSQKRSTASPANDFELLRELSDKKAQLEEEVRQLQAALQIYAEIERRSGGTADSVVSLLPCA